MSNGLIPAQLERLAWLNEELHEVGQAIGKIMRHGYYSFDPSNPSHLGNKADLERELKDIIKAISFLAQCNDISPEFNYTGERVVMKYSHHN